MTEEEANFKLMDLVGELSISMTGKIIVTQQKAKFKTSLI
jgi:hypothetical protein